MVECATNSPLLKPGFLLTGVGLSWRKFGIAAASSPYARAPT